MSFPVGGFLLLISFNKFIKNTLNEKILNMKKSAGKKFYIVFTQKNMNLKKWAIFGYTSIPIIHPLLRDIIY